jgi:hypothetical protein
VLPVNHGPDWLILRLWSENALSCSRAIPASWGRIGDRSGGLIREYVQNSSSLEEEWSHYGVQIRPTLPSIWAIYVLFSYALRHFVLFFNVLRNVTQKQEGRLLCCTVIWGQFASHSILRSLSWPIAGMHASDISGLPLSSTALGGGRAYKECHAHSR